MKLGIVDPSKLEIIFDICEEPVNLKEYEDVVSAMIKDVATKVKTLKTGDIEIWYDSELISVIELKHDMIL
ncbi:MAG: hypothetical protein LBT10_09170 [Methanobrevibacter sp.]|jgi:hypothetical protein|nr:hypothetical protein [Methanobrevibacter sp.]